MQFAKFGEGGKKRVNGAFVDAEGKFTAVEALEFAEALFDLVAEVDETFGVIPEQCAGIGQADGASAANEERLAERILELADGQTDGRLRAVKTLGSAGSCLPLRRSETPGAPRDPHVLLASRFCRRQAWTHQSSSGEAPAARMPGNEFRRHGTGSLV